MSEIDLDYGALTIDTCIFDANGISLEKGLFKQLDQFSGGPVKFVLANVVHYEVLAHLTKEIKEARTKVNLSTKSGEVQSGCKPPPISAIHK